MKWALRYLRGTSDYCITFNNNYDYVCSFVYSYFVGDLDKRRCTSGYVFTLAGGAISWMSKLQDTIFYPLQRMNTLLSHMLAKRQFG